MLEQVLQELNNWFVLPNGIHSEKYEVKDGGISLPFLSAGQYFRVFGSTFNDGLYQYPAGNMVDETFNGVVWALGVPKAVLALADDIAEWQKNNKATAESPFQSESLGNYSYTKRSNSSGGNAGWQSVFRKQLNAWRKL